MLTFRDYLNAFGFAVVGTAVCVVTSIVILGMCGLAILGVVRLFGL